MCDLVANIMAYTALDEHGLVEPTGQFFISPEKKEKKNQEIAEGKLSILLCTVCYKSLQNIYQSHSCNEGS